MASSEGRSAASLSEYGTNALIEELASREDLALAVSAYQRLYGSPDEPRADRDAAYRSEYHERDYIERTIETVRNHQHADNCWPQWANIFADEIERLWAENERLLRDSIVWIRRTT